MDKDWEAENDAHTLSEAEQIKQDRGRLSKAQEAAKRQAAEMEAAAAAASKVANGGSESPGPGSVFKPW